MVIFIPIKENSQRVPRKNFRELNGVPLYKHTLNKLKNFEVYIDTDSDEIAAGIKMDHNLSNVSVYRRDSDLVGDDVSVCDLIQRFIKKYTIFDYICQLHVTSPFLDVDILEEAFNKTKEGYDSVVSCNEVNTRFWRKENYGYVPVNHNPMKLEQTQDLPTYYEENSTFYIFDSSVFKKLNTRIGFNPYFYPIGFPSNVDIDTEDDWNIVKTLGEKNEL